MKNVRTRYAPSPTGYLHIGGARTALFCYLFAKNKLGKFIIRIEDTDKQRNISTGEDSQIDNLKWLGVVPDEYPKTKNSQFGPYRQSERSPIYKKYIDILLKQGMAYKCFCTSEELLELRENQIAQKLQPKYNEKCRNLSANEVNNLENNNKPFSIRLKVPRNIELSWIDQVRGKISVNSNDVEDFIIARPDGSPTYNFCNVIDDHLMDITHVHRGEEHISNTPKQLLIYKMLKWKPPIFCHLTIITNLEGKKLSKRDSDTIQFIEQFKNDGYLPEAVLNFIALLGWSPEDNIEIMSKSEIIKKFTEKRFSKSSTKFDQSKMDWFNSQYIKKLSDEEFLKYAYKFTSNNIIQRANKEKLELLLVSFKRQIFKFSELNHLIKDFVLNSELKIVPIDKNNVNINVVKNILLKFSAIEFNSLDEFKPIIKEISKEEGLSMKEIFPLIRKISTKLTSGPDISTCLYFLGKDIVINNINNYLEELENAK